MQRIAGIGATAQNTFTEGDPARGIPATVVTAAWLNTMQEEIIAVITAAGIPLNAASNNQLKTAIDTIIAATGQVLSQAQITALLNHINTAHQPLLTAADAQSTAILSYADANTLIKTGFYNGFGKNWAIQADWQYMIVIRHTSVASDFTFQEAFDFYTDQSFQRRSNNGVWSPWVRSSGNSMVGKVIAFAGTTPLSGWLECNGTAVSRNAYADLFNVIGITFGGGNGTTTFNIPDLRGEFVRGWDHAKGVDAGRVLGSWQADMLKSHTHTYSRPGAGGAITSAYYYSQGLPTQNSGATGGIETRPRNVAMMYCIKY